MKNELSGCINDAENLKSLLIGNFNYSDDNIVLMTDNANDNLYPSLENILSQLEKLVSEAESDDLDELWISYSGHGSYTWDQNNDEKDRRDELLCPLDYDSNGGITDDVINSYLSRIPVKCHVICLFDCCHSGTLADLTYNYSYDKTPDRRERVIKRIKKLVRPSQKRYFRKRERESYTVNGIKRYRYVTKRVSREIPAKYRYVNSYVWVTIPGILKLLESQNLINKDNVKCKLLTISGCRDPQTSADVYYKEINQWNGALSKSFIEIVNQTTDRISCLDMCQELNSSMLSQKLTQRPVVSSSYKLSDDHIFYRCPKCPNTFIKF
jgi:hypothetical protein